MENQSYEDAIKWDQKLNSPLPGHGKDDFGAEDEMAQLTNL